MIQVRSDPDRNRLYITMAGRLDGPERQGAIMAILAEAAKLREGFGVVSDISGLHASDQDGFKDFLRAKEALKLRGAGPVVRVVKIPLSRIQMGRISTDAGFDAEEVSTLEEADRWLDEAEGKH